MTIKGQSATAHFHTDRNDNKAQTFMFNTSKQLKGFWFFFTGQYDILLHKKSNEYYQSGLPLLYKVTV